MGSCCSKEEKSELLDPKEAKLAILESKKEESEIERAGRAANYQDTPEDAQFKHGLEEIKSHNEKTNVRNRIFIK